ncbi:hypothetical protein T265_15180, partial [Opisthorchis viverrini]
PPETTVLPATTQFSDQPGGPDFDRWQIFLCYGAGLNEMQEWVITPVLCSIPKNDVLTGKFSVDIVGIIDRYIGRPLALNIAHVRGWHRENLGGIGGDYMDYKDVVLSLRTQNEAAIGGLDGRNFHFLGAGLSPKKPRNLP